jgi:hypothetical protein
MRKNEDRAAVIATRHQFKASSNLLRVFGELGEDVGNECDMSGEWRTKWQRRTMEIVAETVSVAKGSDGSAGEVPLV